MTEFWTITHMGAFESIIINTKFYCVNVLFDYYQFLKLQENLKIFLKACPAFSNNPSNIKILYISRVPIRVIQVSKIQLNILLHL